MTSTPTLYQCIQHSRIVSDVVLDGAFQEAFRKICAELGVELGAQNESKSSVGKSNVSDSKDAKDDEFDFSDVLIDRSPKRGKNMSREESLSAFLRFPDELDSMGFNPSDYAQDFPELDVGFDLYEATFDDPLDVTVRTKLFNEKEHKAEDKTNKTQSEQDMFAGYVVDFGSRKTDSNSEVSERFFDVDDNLFDLGEDEHKDEETEDQSASELAKLLTPETQEKFDKYFIDALLERNAINKWQASQLCCGRSTFTLGNYRIVDLLGQGGYGRVFLARPQRVPSNVGKTGSKTKDDVAIKVLPFKNAKTTEPIGKFLREVEIAKRLEHPNLVRCFESSKDASVHYCVSEYVDGGDARKLLAEHIKTKGKLHYRIAAYIIAEAAKGLAYMHKQGVVHRDVKPGNILLMKTGEVKIADFGMASVIRNFSSGSTFSSLGETIEAWELANAKTYFKSEKAVQAMKLQIQGTPDYLAPDQLSSEGVKRPNPLWDVYSLGCSLYFMLTGMLPYSSNGSIETLRTQMLGSVPPEPLEYDQTLPRELSLLTMHMMEKNPKERAKYVDSASAAVKALERWVPYEKIENYRRFFLGAGENFWSDEHLEKIFVQGKFTGGKGGGIRLGGDDSSSISNLSQSGGSSQRSSIDLPQDSARSKSTSRNDSRSELGSASSAQLKSAPSRAPSNDFDGLRTPPPVKNVKNDYAEELARLERRNSRLIKFVLLPLLGLTLATLVVAIVSMLR